MYFTNKTLKKESMNFDILYSHEDAHVDIKASVKINQLMSKLQNCNHYYYHYHYYFLAKFKCQCWCVGQFKVDSLHNTLDLESLILHTECAAHLKVKTHTDMRWIRDKRQTNRASDLGLHGPTTFGA